MLFLKYSLYEFEKFVRQFNQVIAWCRSFNAIDLKDDRFWNKDQKDIILTLKYVNRVYLVGNKMGIYFSFLISADNSIFLAKIA